MFLKTDILDWAAHTRSIVVSISMDILRDILGNIYVVSILWFVIFKGNKLVCIHHLINIQQVYMMICILQTCQGYVKSTCVSYWCHLGRVHKYSVSCIYTVHVRMLSISVSTCFKITVEIVTKLINCLCEEMQLL